MLARAALCACRSCPSLRATSAPGETQRLSGAETSATLDADAGRDIHQSPCHPTHSVPQTGWWRRCACSRASSYRTGLSLAAAPAEFDLTLEFGSFHPNSSPPFDRHSFAAVRRRSCGTSSPIPMCAAYSRTSCHTAPSLNASLPTRPFASTRREIGPFSIPATSSHPSISCFTHRRHGHRGRLASLPLEIQKHPAAVAHREMLTVHALLLRIAPRSPSSPTLKRDHTGGSATMRFPSTSKAPDGTLAVSQTLPNLTAPRPVTPVEFRFHAACVFVAKGAATSQ